MQAVWQLGCPRAGNREGNRGKEITKKVEKLLKNLLTNEKRCDIILGHFLTGRQERAKRF